MKKIFKCLFLAAAMTLSLASCGDEAEIPSTGPVAHPQEETVGTYTGTWSRQELGQETIVTAPGSAVFSSTEANYVTNIVIKCDELSIDLESVANISVGGPGYMFHNTLATNGFGAIFSGTVSKAGEVTLSFKKTVKEGRKSYTYTYTFNGSKQN